MEKGSSKVLYYVVIAIVVVAAIFFIYQGRKEEVLQIGVIQIAEHPALDSARDGFIEALADGGYIEGENVEYDLQNAQGDMSTANTISQKMDAENPDLVLSIATPACQAAANNIEDTPILITAITDPVDAGVVDSMESPGGNVTGTTDMTPIGKQLDLLKEIVPDAETVGVIYNAGESNSQVQMEITEQEAKRVELEVVEATADNTSGVMEAARSLSDEVDAFYVFTDNTAVSALSSVVMVAEENDIPLIVGEPDSVENGGLATEGLSYYELGYQTGEMALDILENDADPAEMPIQSQKETKLVINEEAAENMGVDIPEDVLDRADEVY
ncbi:MAG: ABC transporter substrate-binding protein [Halanaerobiales bacterium]